MMMPAYIFAIALDSVQPLRNIRCPPEVEQVLLHREATTAVLFRGNLHWHIEQNETESNMIVIFNTTAESFRQMHAPVVPVFRNVPAYADLFDMDGVLGILSCDEAANTIDIWVLRGTMKARSGPSSARLHCRLLRSR